MLYFAYDGFLEPERLGEVAPAARFQQVAHLPETRLIFTSPDGLPSVEPAPGNTVWGGIFEISEGELEALTAAEAAEGRHPRNDLRAVDRAGHKYDVVTFAHHNTGVENDPSRAYMTRVVKGARHWGLPTGWVVGLEEYAEDALI
jgi:gamma-glutamylcyclotransferase